MKYIYFKNTFDFSLALVSIIIVSPLFLLLIFTNLIILGKPIFFNQERPGYRENVCRNGKDAFFPSGAQGLCQCFDRKAVFGK